ncbi:hypothetical protein AGRA3207_005309 [Actinomadura graeca]|uniref:Uncharacterized protein n=1 Tax=Actinomadura graeca TaxID=2750812 RepID=A0ABX8QZG3_9ACTN|nr:hypothetical protein [Actinomadura graeca]QXJ24058.1 hypothetical protein AGRA3207_005309 [Actinomadura graeca]
MSGDLGQLASHVTQHVTTAAGAYGVAVLVRTRDQAAEAMVGLGQRLAQRILGARAEGEELPEPLADVIDDPDDSDNQAALREAIHKALAANTELAAQVQQWVRDAQSAGGQVSTSGERSPAVQTNQGIIATGDGNTFLL